MDRTVSVSERYDKKEGEFLNVAKCAFCEKENVMLRGTMHKKCSHFVREGHGCGGNVFIFRKGD